MKKSFNQLIFSCFSFLLPFVGFTQGNTPCTASALSVNASCTYSAGTTVAATYQNDAVNGGTPSCGSPGAPDVWYSFVAPASGSVTITTTANSITDGAMALYSGTCGGGKTFIECDDDDGPGSMPEIIRTGLTPGNTYWIRFWKYGSGTGTFNICITFPPPPPANDNCTGAVALTVNPNLSCASVTAGNTAGMTQSQAGCTGTADDDVWFSFVATATTHKITISNTFTDMVFQVFSGACGGLVNRLCSDPETNDVTGLTIGATYFVRVYTWSSFGTSAFNICVGTYPPPPANDECVNAITLTANANNLCGVVTPGSLFLATASANANTCPGDDDDDVWFKFVATDNSHTVDLLNVTGGTTMQHSVTTSTCGAATNVGCGYSSSLLTNLTIGNTYYVRVYSYWSNAETTTFNVCIGTPVCSNPATNDYCSNPTLINQGGGGVGASTGSFTIDLPGNVNSLFCGSIENNAWYQFIAASATETFTFTSITGCALGIQAEVFDVAKTTSGCCVLFTAKSNCLQTSTTGTVTATGLTIGKMYMLMIDGNAGAACNYTLSNWSLASVLPIELLSFNGKSVVNENQLQWRTTSEINNKYFAVERSSDGINFQEIGQVVAKGNSEDLATYYFSDLQFTGEVSYYRLRQVDNNANFTFSHIIALNHAQNNPQGLTVYPNPFSNNIVISFDKPTKSNFQVDFTNYLGQHILQQTIPKQSNKITLELDPNLKEGVYFVRIFNQSEQYIKKIIK